MKRKINLRNNFIHFFGISSNNYFISSNGHFIGLINQQGQLSLYSKQNFKQYWKLSCQSFLYTFSPSDKLLAIANKRLIVIKIGSQKQIYNQPINQQEYRIESIDFIQETILLAASFIASKIFKINIANQQTTCIIQLANEIQQFNYDSVNQNILFMLQGTDYMQIWNVDGNKLFQSASLQDIPKEIKLIDSDNFIIARFPEYSLIYQINYEELKLQFLTLQQSKYIETIAGPLFHYDFISKIIPNFFINPQVFTFLFKLEEKICQIERQLHIPLQKLLILPSKMSYQKNIMMARNNMNDNYVHYLVKRFSEK